ncbi:MAG: 2Fe-2S iron-sulfur cluster binding domain-containing protein [Acetobacteraceae bacterium]|nr:2Fe-2S iron-sulfur cluster binding domain-containing protein [Acetobacteraceae bacterium]
MLFSWLILRRVRLASGLILLFFVAGHLSNLALGLVSIEAMEQWRAALLIPWQTSFGQALLLAAAIVHAALGLVSLASRHSLAMSRTDWVQLLLGLATPPLLLNHVVGLQVTSDLVARFRADYGYVLAVYWHYAPLFALQQLLVVVIVWAHGAIGLYSTLVLQRAWPRVAPVVIPILFAIPILALLGFAHAGERVLARLASDPDWRALIEQNLLIRQQMAHRLGVIQGGVFLVYVVAVAAAVSILAAKILRHRRIPVIVSYDAGLTAIGRVGMSVLEVSRANHIPHASVCGGRARCGTCRIIVPTDADLDLPAEAELATLRRVQAPADARLACQAHLLGRPVSVRRVYPAFVDAEAARQPDSWPAETEPALDTAP